MKIANPTARLGEDVATAFLKKKGYTILERNFRKGYGEIDIIAVGQLSQSAGEKVLVFVEVKTRSSLQFGTPLESITPWKLATVIRTAQYYTLLHPKLPVAMRIDAIAVFLGMGNVVTKIEHSENISG